VDAAQAEQQRDLDWLLGPGRMQRVAFDDSGIAERLEPIATALAGEAGRAMYRQIRQLG
jgi:hypothetical protein